ncbi:unnamed protein product [Spirodela intermedia]|uniref:Uncharacterized protein n=1 Tax=Spirodela intermedia TaxID=51605 RepID=A0A7I8ITQ3_SPIIN|nr:unnamed protein product [Spirodela intermedia]CAA6660344.1 unnamed protein product [Spirodela intermedia]
MGSANLNRTTSSHISRRNLSFSGPRVSVHRKVWGSLSAYTVATAFFLISSILALGCVLYLSLFRTSIHRGVSPYELIGRTHGCDVFEGSWIPDSSYPLYNSSTCPFVERGFNCLANGRRDTEYLKWRWKPRQCHVPRGKRVVFVGDSMSRTQWESFICMLMTGVREPKSVYEVKGNKISKRIRFLGVRFHSFNFTQGLPPRHGPKRIQSTLKLDKLDDISEKWVDSDVLVFNSGHWWNPGKLFDSGCYFQVGGSLKLGMPITAAFKMAMETWASWVETMVDTDRTHIFFRTFEPSHWSGPNQEVCELTKQPVTEATGEDRSEFLGIITDVVARMRAPVTILNVTSMGAVRSDAHIGPWGDLRSLLDCSHWCLPGVPDAWNELIFHLLGTLEFPVRPSGGNPEE